MTPPLVLAAPLSLTGRYAAQGRLAAAGLARVVEDIRSLGGVLVGEERREPRLLILDDRSTRAGVTETLDAMGQTDLLIGPYGSDLVAEAAGWAASRGRVLWNHGGNADDVQRLPGLVSIGSPASTYLGAVLEALTEHLPGARVMVAAGRGGFGRSAARGAREAAERLGVRVVGMVAHREVPEAPDADILLGAGSFADDLALVPRLQVRPPAVAAVAAGMSAFGAELGRLADGVLAPSQWEERVRFRVDVGPRPAEVVRSLRAAVVGTLGAGVGSGHVDYPAAQAYAAGLIAMRCVEEAGGLEDGALAEAARRLRCTTFFGRFELGEDGRQVGHEVLVVQWQEGMKAVVWPPSQAETAVAL